MLLVRSSWTEQGSVPNEEKWCNKHSSYMTDFTPNSGPYMSHTNVIILEERLS